MVQTETAAPAVPASRALSFCDGLVHAAIAFAALTLWWLSRHYAADMPAWTPWDFSFVEFLAGWLAAWWYLRGLLLTPVAERPSVFRHLSFFAGLVAIYIVLETRFEYLAEHQFFFNRIQHVAMHHIGPLLIALGWPGAMLKRGMPRIARRLVDHPLVTGTVYVLQQPVLAFVLFVGLFFFWLIPAIHFRAMIDPTIYAAMNWSMTVDGILFWCLVLDPRPSPPARISFGVRAVLCVSVMFPQIIGGAMITFSPRDLYTFYDLCGRIYPGLGAHYDQSVGGLIVWIPPAMMSIAALLIVLTMLRKAEEAANIAYDGPGPLIDSRSWTG